MDFLGIDTHIHTCYTPLMKKTNRREVARQLRKKGLTLQAIGDILGISRQRVHALLRNRAKVDNSNFDPVEKPKNKAV